MTTRLDLFLFGTNAKASAELLTAECIRAVALPDQSLTATAARDAGKNSDTVAFIDSSTFPDLSPKSPPNDRRWLVDHVRELQPSGAPRVELIALKAGLLQLHDFLDDSHSESQSIEGEGCHRAGDYWHAIMHRREGDFGNSKYWFRRVGSHPIYADLAEHAVTILAKHDHQGVSEWRPRLIAGGRWDSCAFVDLCEMCNRGDHALSAAAREIQWTEMLLMLNQTCADALG